MSRKYTNTLLEMIENGLLTNEAVVNACMSYMSEDDVRDMMEHNDFIEVKDEE